MSISKNFLNLITYLDIAVLHSWQKWLISIKLNDARILPTFSNMITYGHDLPVNSKQAEYIWFVSKITL